MILAIKQGDILKEQTDAIVNPTNELFDFSGQVAGALLNKVRFEYTLCLHRKCIKIDKNYLKFYILFVQSAVYKI